MLNALMGAIGEVDTGNRTRPIQQGQYFRLTMVVSTASATIDALADRLRAMADTNPALLRNGRVAIATADQLTLAGNVSMSWDHVGDFIDSLLQVVYATIPAEMLRFEGDIFTEPIVDPNADPKTGPTPVIGPPATGVNPIDPLPPTPTPTPSSPTLFGIPVIYLAIGGAVLLFMSKGK